jgi:large subunit ribosomal protein L25
METVRIRAQSRPRIGTRFARALRKSGNLPAILYGHGLDPVAMSLPLHDLQVALDHGARTLEVDLDGKEEQCLIKEVQYDHLQATPMHVDLMRVYRDEHVRVEVGIELKGIPAGVHDGGFLDQVMAKLPIDCLVTGIPQTLHPVVTHLALGDALYVRDLQLPPGVVALADPDASPSCGSPPHIAPRRKRPRRRAPNRPSRRSSGAPTRRKRRRVDAGGAERERRMALLRWRGEAHRRTRQSRAAV